MNFDGFRFFPPGKVVLSKKWLENLSKNKHTQGRKTLLTKGRKALRT
tara:strand:- start:312 stop:452 length:141 start_codon:yes stop_codon:yes gene_type:complete